MISITSAQLDAWLVAFIWPFTRILGLLAVMPVTGGPQFPARGKIGLALLISIVVGPTLPPLPPIDPASWGGLFMLAHELAIGLAIGFLMRLVFAAVELAADLIGLQMGLGFAVFIPFLIIDMLVASVLMSMGMMMVSPVMIALPFKIMLFVLVDGWNLLLGSLAQSFGV